MVQKRLKQIYKSGRVQDVLSALEKIMSGDRQGLDIKKIQGRTDTYRCRIGDFRIVFSKNTKGDIKVLFAGVRGDVYK